MKNDRGFVVAVAVATVCALLAIIAVVGWLLAAGNNLAIKTRAENAVADAEARAERTEEQRDAAVRRVENEMREAISAATVEANEARKRIRGLQECLRRIARSEHSIEIRKQAAEECIGVRR